VAAGVTRGAILLALIAYCLAVGATAAGALPTSLLLLLLAPPALAVAVAIGLRYFQMLVLALPLTALTLPYAQVGTGTQTALPLSLLLTLFLTGLWAASLLAKGWRLVPTPLNRPLLTFAGVCIVSFLWSLAWRDPGLVKGPNFLVVQSGALATILVSLSAALLIGNFVSTERQLKYIVACFLLVGALMLLAELLQTDQPLLNIRGLWGTWFVACAYGLLITQPGLRRRWRVLLVVLLAVTFYQTMVVKSYWLSGWVPSIVAVMAISFLRSRKLFVAILLVGLVGLIASLGFFERVAQDNINDGSLERLDLWAQNLTIVREHWLLGTGPAGYSIYYRTYFPRDLRATHNNYLDILSQFGVVGFSAWLWVILASLREGWSLLKTLQPGFLRTLTIIATGGWAAGLASMVLGDWILPYAYNQTINGYKYTVYSWIFLGTLICIRKLHAAQAPATPTR